MRSLLVVLSFLLVLAPAQGQQAVRQSAPNFYVPYGVRDLPVTAGDEEYSSSEMRFSQTVTMAIPSAPMPRRRHPVRQRPSHRHGPVYGALPQPEMSSTGVLITLGVIAAILGGCAIAGAQ